MINWKVRMRNKTFWVCLIPAVLVLIQSLAAVFGFTLNLDEVGNDLLQVVEAVFVLLAVMGVVNDPTTAGMNDSAQAMTYIKPKERE